MFRIFNAMLKEEQGADTVKKATSEPEEAEGIPQLQSWQLLKNHTSGLAKTKQKQKRPGQKQLMLFLTGTHIYFQFGILCIILYIILC